MFTKRQKGRRSEDSKSLSCAWMLKMFHSIVLFRLCAPFCIKPAQKISPSLSFNCASLGMSYVVVFTRRSLSRLITASRSHTTCASLSVTYGNPVGNAGILTFTACILTLLCTFVLVSCKSGKIDGWCAAKKKFNEELICASLCSKGSPLSQEQCQNVQIGARWHCLFYDERFGPYCGVDCKEDCAIRRL